MHPNKALIWETSKRKTLKFAAELLETNNTLTDVFWLLAPVAMELACREKGPAYVEHMLLKWAGDMRERSGNPPIAFPPIDPGSEHSSTDEECAGREFAKQSASQDAQNEFAVRAQLLAREIGPSEAVNVLAGAALGVLTAAFNREKAVEYFLNIAADLQHSERPKSEPEA